MNWWIVDPETGNVEMIADNTKGRSNVLEHVTEILSNGYEAKDVLIFRGERHEFIPPQDKGTLIQTDKGL